MEATSASKKDQRWAQIAYDSMAAVYDDFTDQNDYEMWLGRLLPKAERHGLHGKRLLDVACGTGKSFIPMLKRGWEVTACDISASMVELARAKVGEEAKLSVADMRELPELGEFDLVLCLDDALNYLLSTDELERTMAGMRRNLAADGLLMFDVNTIETYRGFFAEEIVVERDGRRLLWHGHSSPDQAPRSINEASFEALPADGESGPAIAPQLHRQRHFPEADVLAAFAAAGLECLDVFGHEDDAIPQQPLEENRHTKAVYIARSSRLGEAGR